MLILTSRKKLTGAKPTYPSFKSRHDSKISPITEINAGQSGITSCFFSALAMIPIASPTYLKTNACG